MMFLSTGTGLLACVIAVAVSIIAALVSAALGSVSDGDWPKLAGAAGFVLFQITAALCGFGAVLSLLLNVIRFAKAV